MKSFGRQTQQGFTIIELMIATLVFTTILIVVTASVLRFTKQYYKGVIASQTQNTARAIMDDVVRSIQFNKGNVSILTKNDPTASPGIYGYCIGDSKRYSFLLNRQVEPANSAPNHQARFGLVSDTTSGCSTGTLARNTETLPSLPAGGRELLGQHMRLNKFSITFTDDIYTINVKVIYGDDALLCSPSQASECSPNGVASNASLETKQDLTCRAMSGSQFCAVSELTTTVKKRVN